MIKNRTQIISFLSILIAVFFGVFIYKEFYSVNLYRTIFNSKRNLKREKNIEINCPAKALTIAYFGQSNSTNKVRPLANLNINKNIYQYDWKTGNCYLYQEPLLAVHGKFGNVISYTAIEFIRNHPNKSLLIIPFGVGGSSVLDWSYGYLSYLHDLVLESVEDNGLYPDIFLWHQGEDDRRHKNSNPQNLFKMSNFQKAQRKNMTKLGLSEKTYYDALNLIFKKTLNYFPNSKFGIALVSKCKGENTWPPIREAQKRIIVNNQNAFLSSDSDKIELRHDGCHFSSKGARIIGRDYYFSIVKELGLEKNKKILD